MSNGRNIIRNPGGGFFDGLADHARLVWRLVTDERVGPFLKLIPVGSLVYLIIPFDVPGPLDDAAILWLGTYLFIEMCPPEVVAEHREAIANMVSANVRDVGEIELPAEEDIIDADYTEE